MISVKKGIDLPIEGAVKDSSIRDMTAQGAVAILGEDFLGLKPTMLVAEGDSVKKGQALLEDKKNPGVFICSPVAGTITAINRGERRRLLSVVITPGGDDAIKFDKMDHQSITQLSREHVCERLQKVGFWAMLRKRPYNKIPAIDAVPHSIFVNMMDSNPLSIDPSVALEGRDEDLKTGLTVIKKLTEGNVNFCHDAKQKAPEAGVDGVVYHQFSGIHPAGNVGTHIHFIDAVSMEKQVWHLSIQDLLAIGHLFNTGDIENEKIISIAGPGVKNPQYAKVTKGSDINKLLSGNIAEGEQRIISGSVFSGRKAEDKTSYLGAYDQQIVVLPEGRDAIFLEFFRPGCKTYSKSRAYLGRFISKHLPFTTSVQGSPRAVLPFGIYESVMPLDILPTLLLKSLIIKDTDSAVQLGALELDEEDIALLTYVDPGKHDFGAILRENLEQIEKDG